MKAWALIVVGAVLGLVAGGFFGHSCWPTSSTPAAVAKDAAAARGELAEERIPQIEAKAKTTRRVARARYEQEVDDASSASDLAGYVNSRNR